MTIRIASRVSAAFAVMAFALPLAAQPVSSAGVQPGSTTINFNTLTAGTPVSNQYAGVTVTGGLCGNSDYSPYFGGDPMQVTNFLNFATVNCNGSIGQPFTFTFAQSITSFGFNSVTDGGNINFFTANGSVSVPRHLVGSTAGYTGFTDATPFNYVSVSIDGDGLIGFDDVSYAVVATPEPASLVLLGTGLLGVFGVARRKRTA